MTKDGTTACPDMSLLCKLGSIAIHAAEFLSSDAHAFDRDALDQLLHDDDVVEWLDGMEKQALVPKRRIAAGPLTGRSPNP